MATITLPTTFVDGTVPTAAQFNGDFTTIVNEFNGNIDNANIKSGAAIATTKIAGTAMALAGEQTVTGVKFFDVATKPKITTDTDGSTVTFDMDASSIHFVTIAGNRTFAVSNTDAGQIFIVIVRQDGTGSRTVTWFSGILWAGGSAPTLTTTASKYDTFGFVTVSAGVYLGFVIGLNA